jgi:hypothetical protein
MIQRLPQLHYTLENACIAASRELPADYERELRRVACDIYDQLADAIHGAQLEGDDRKRAAAALETLRRSPAKRARLNSAARVLIEIDPHHNNALFERSRTDLAANLDTNRECVAAEVKATRTLIDLLYVAAA